MKHKIGLTYIDILSARKTKRDLPLVLKLQKTFDIKKLQNEFDQLLNQIENKTKDYEFDRASNEHNYNLSNKSGGNFVPNYDEVYKNYASIGFQSLTDEALDLGSKINQSIDSFTPYERTRGMRYTDSKYYHPFYDERNYTKKTEFYNGYIAEILDSFEDEVCRSAAVVLQPGKFLAPHFDIGPEYVTRLQMPIITNEKAVIGFRKDPDIWFEYHLPADGSVYFVNSGWEHYAVNNGSEDRYQIRICLNGQKSLENAEEIFPTSIFSYDVFSKRVESGNYFGKNENNLNAAALTELGMDAESYNKYASAKT